MTNIRMKARDTLFISSWSSENIPPDGEFEVSTARADELEAAGLADRMPEKQEKAEKAAPANKARKAPANKGAK
jgi:hypothetical protein